MSQGSSAYSLLSNAERAELHWRFIVHMYVMTVLYWFRPAKRQRQQGMTHALQSQRQAWMDKLTAEAAAEVSCPYLPLHACLQAAVLRDTSLQRRCLTNDCLKLHNVHILLESCMTTALENSCVSCSPIARSEAR